MSFLHVTFRKRERLDRNYDRACAVYAIIQNEHPVLIERDADGSIIYDEDLEDQSYYSFVIVEDDFAVNYNDFYEALLDDPKIMQFLTNKELSHYDVVCHSDGYVIGEFREIVLEYLAMQEKEG